MDSYYHGIMQLEYYLKKHDYLTGDQMTYVDVVAFIEIDTLNTIYQQELPRECPKLIEWYRKFK